MNVHARRTMTFEEYGRWGPRHERKHELVRGEPRMLEGREDEIALPAAATLRMADI